MVNVPQFLMGSTIRDDWMQGAQGVSNALARYAQQGMQQRKLDQQQGQFEAQNALARAGMAQSDRHFNASNALAQRTADRADALAPGQLELQKAQIAHARAQGASEVQLAPYILEIKRNEALLAKAKAEGKDAESMMFRDILGGGQPAQPPAQQPMMPGVRPQSFNGGQQPMMPTPVVDAGQPGMNALAPQQADPNLILAQSGPAPQPQAPAQPSVRDVVQGMTPTEKGQFALSMTGKGDAAKVLGEVAARQKFGKEGSNELDKQIIARVSDVSELDNIKTQFNPKYLEVGGRAKALGVSLKAYISSGSVSPEDRKYLTDFTRFAAATTERFNNRIKANAGTAVSGAEETRMKTANPNASDDPITFEAKLNEQMALQKAATMRFNWLRTQGASPDKIAEFAKSGKIEALAGLDDMRNIYDKRASEIENQFKRLAPQIQPQQLRAVTKERLKQEFGI